MKLINLSILLLLVFTTSHVFAEASDMEVMTWEADCQHTMTTNHFMLEPGEEIEIDLDLGGCQPERLGGMLFFGYKTTKNASKPLTSRDKIRLTLVEERSNNRVMSNDGSIYVEVNEAGGCKLYAANTGHKAIKVRFRSSVGL